MLNHEPVPGNRWDLLTTAPEPEVSVVVTHFNQPRQLERTCRALSRQSLRPVEIIIADDGSSQLPTPVTGDIAIRVVSQPDLGFRAAAARNLGARCCQGEVLVFLDADTTPEPDFLRHLTRRVASCRDVVAVGRRRHAELDAVPFDADPTDAPQLAEPAWLRDGYIASRDLLDADGRSFRYVISAVLACRRSLYAELGGFDERFVGYGGEDWDFAYRAWNAGAIFVHEATAVAWHDGPEWADRSGPGLSHDRQSMRLAALIPEPLTRGAPLPGNLPDVLVDIAADLELPSVVRCIHSVIRQTFADRQVRAEGQQDAALHELYRGVIRTSPWDPDQLRRARARLIVKSPLPPHALAGAMQLVATRDVGIVDIRASGQTVGTLTSTRALGRARRWADAVPCAELIERHFGRMHFDAGTPPAPRDDLAQFFAGGR